MLAGTERPAIFGIQYGSKKSKLRTLDSGIRQQKSQLISWGKKGFPINHKLLCGSGTLLRQEAQPLKCE